MERSGVENPWKRFAACSLVIETKRQIRMAAEPKEETGMSEAPAEMKQRVYIGELRQCLGLAKDDASRDGYIEGMKPRQRLRMLCGWHLGDPGLAESFIDWARDAGLTVKG
jgi:hypothetical protein